MTSKLEVISTISTSDCDAPLCMNIWLDDQEIFANCHIQDKVSPVFSFDLEDGVHTLIFKMTGKFPEHTTLDNQNNIVKDARLKIEELSFNGIDISQIVAERAVYQHCFNGNSELVNEHF